MESSPLSIDLFHEDMAMPARATIRPVDTRKLSAVDPSSFQTNIDRYSGVIDLDKLAR